MRLAVRRLRGIVTMSLLWGFAWGVAGGVLGLWLHHRINHSWHDVLVIKDGVSVWVPAWLAALRSARSAAMSGAMCGALFAVVLSIAERRRAGVRAVSIGRTLGWGALGVTAVGAAYLFASRYDAALARHLFSPFFLTAGQVAASAVFGGLLAAGTVALARRAPERTLERSDEPDPRAMLAR
jgi:hypothetical protein